VVYVSNVAGATQANGRWVVTVIDGSTIDLQSSSFSSTYTSGGSIALRQELRIALTSTPTTPLEVVVGVRYLNPLTSAISGVDTVLAELPSSTSVTVLVSHDDYDSVVDVCNVFNADGSTRIAEWTVADYANSGKLARASIATNERANLSGRGGLAVYSANGRSYQEAL
jgi:hypothetical protein